MCQNSQTGGFEHLFLAGKHKKTRDRESGSDRLNQFAISSYAHTSGIGILMLETYREQIVPVNTLLYLQSYA